MIMFLHSIQRYYKSNLRLWGIQLAFILNLVLRIKVYVFYTKEKIWWKWCITQFLVIRIFSYFGACVIPGEFLKKC